MGVKTIAVFSAEEALEALKNAFFSKKNTILCVPHAIFRSYFLQKYPKFPSEAVHTPSSLLQLCGLHAIPEDILCQQSRFSFFQDASLFQAEKEEEKDWMRQNQWVSWWNAPKLHPPFQRFLFLGDFSQKVRMQIGKCLSQDDCEGISIERHFRPIEKEETFKQISVQSVTSIGLEYAWLEQKRAEDSQAFTILLPSVESWQFFFQKPLPEAPFAWIDWQEQGTGTFFLRYLRLQEKQEDFAVHAKDLQAARSVCLTDRFEVLRFWLLQHEKSWIEPFVCPTTPTTATIGEYIKGYRHRFPKEFSFLTGWENCPTQVGKREFFGFLRKILQQKQGIEPSVLPWKDAAYLPIHKGIVPHVVHTDTISAAAVHSWLAEVATKGSLSVCYPLVDDEGDSLSLLVPVTQKESSLRIVSNERQQTRVGNFSKKSWQEQQGSMFTVHFQNVPKKQTTSLQIPMEATRFSCKTWEEFYQYPRKTWLEKVLKTVSVPMHASLQKAKFLGDCVHEWLAFEETPRKLGDWEAQIQQKACRCQKQYEKIPLLQQWQQRALFFALQMARACEDFLQDGWQLTSEWSLPREAKFPGRIDLLAIHPEQQKLVIVDYKTALHYSFTLTQLKHGCGWQLLLYGKELQRLYSSYSIFLQVIQRNGKVAKLSLPQTMEAMQAMEAWIQHFQQTGCYEELPEESDRGLPLTYLLGKKW